MAAQDDRQKKALRDTFRQLWREVGLAFLLAATLSGIIVLSVEGGRRQDAEAQARNLASAAAHDLGSQLDRALSSSYALSTLVRQGKGRIEGFDSIAREMLLVYGGISALQLAPGGVVSQVVPLAGNEAVIGFSPLDDPVQGPEARRVIERRSLGLTGPFELRQGGIGVVGRNPIFLPDANGQESFWGFSQVLIRISDLLAETRFDGLKNAGYDYELWRILPDAAERHVFVRSSKAALVEPVVESVRVPNSTWMVGVAPVNGWLSPTHLVLEISGALLFSVLVAVTVFFLLRQPALLQREVDARTRDLAASEEKYRLMFAHNPVPMLVYEKSGLTILDANDALIDSYGYGRDALPGMTILDLRPEQERSRLLEFVGKEGSNGFRQAGSWQHQRRNGEIFDVEITSHDVDYQGRPARLVMATDVTERHRAEETLRRQNVWLKSILEHFPDGISVVDGEQRIAVWNSKFLKLLDFPEEMFLRQPSPCLLDFLRFNAERGEYGEVDVETYIAQAAARINLHESHRFERTRPNGQVLEVRGSPLPDGGFVTTYSDITARKVAEKALLDANQRYEQLNLELEGRVVERTRLLATEIEERRSAEEAVRRSAEWLREIIDTLSSGMVLWSKQQRLMAWNAAFEKMFPQACATLVVGEERSTLLEVLNDPGGLGLHSAESGAWENIGHWERHLSDGRIVEIERLATGDGGRLVIYTDVTHARQTSDILARNERMASLGSLVAGIAHEINTPIGNALMVASTVGHRIGELETDIARGALKRSLLESFLSSVRESSEILERNLHRAASLIQNFKQVAVDQTSDRRRSFELSEVLEEVRMTLAPRLRRALPQLEIDVPAGIHFDSYPGALGQVVGNLVENALLHAFAEGQGGTMRLHAQLVDDGLVELLFSDTGAGIPADVLPRIFDPFFTTRLGKGGSGLGLSIVLNLVRDLLGGEMTVNSRAGEGTSFRIILPAVAPQRVEHPVP